MFYHKPLFVFLLFHVFVSTLNINIASAEPLCYLIDANGNRINLSGVCIQSSQGKTPSTQAPPSSDSTPVNPNPSVNIQNDSGSVMGIDTTNTINNSVNSNNTGETGTSRFVPKIQRRRIPLLQ